MSDSTHRDLSFTVPARLSNIPVARRTVGDHLTELGCAENRVVDAMIAVNEAVTNAATHAYRGEDGEIQVGVHTDDTNVHVTVSDFGRGPGPNLDGKQRSYGLPMMAALADLLTVSGSPENGYAHHLDVPTTRVTKGGRPVEGRPTRVRP